MKLETRPLNDGAKTNVADIDPRSRTQRRRLISGALALALSVSAHANAAPDAATINNTLGPSSAAGVLFLWRQKHNYTVPGADATYNAFLRSTASTGVTSMLTYLGADGSFPDPDPALAEINNAYLALRDTLDANSRKKWLEAMMKITTFLIVDGDLPDPAKTGWQGTSGWYTNGNYEALEALDLYQRYLARATSGTRICSIPNGRPR